MVCTCKKFTKNKKNRNINNFFKKFKRLYLRYN